MVVLSVQNLYELSDAPVRTAVTNLFMLQLQAAPSVSAFFTTTLPIYELPVEPDWVDDVASALVCSSIARSSLYSFGGTINQLAADACWAGLLADTNTDAITVSQALYDRLFWSNCAGDGQSFAAYGANASFWARSFAAQLSSPVFINETMLKLIGDDPNWLQILNLALYKLRRLDGALVDGVVGAWQNASPNAGIVQNWQTANYLPADMIEPDVFINQVNTAIAVETSHAARLGRVGATAIVHGEAVASFIQGKATALGLATGADPKNVAYCPTDCPSSGSCFVAGTTLHLADGSTIPIEQAGPGIDVLARNGLSSSHGPEHVVVELERDTLIYGFNELAPFFVGGHPFLTADGWKAVIADHAREQNPMLEFGTLSLGDTVYCIESTTPFAYRAVRISRITSSVLTAGSVVYSAFLMGERSFHVNGYCVMSNYPMITEGRLMAGLATLTPSERKALSRALGPVMPLLKRAVGDFVERPIRRALAQAPEPRK
jgi:hypothetical protein